MQGLNPSRHAQLFCCTQPFAPGPFLHKMPINILVFALGTMVFVLRPLHFAEGNPFQFL